MQAAIPMRASEGELNANGMSQKSNIDNANALNKARNDDKEIR